MKTNPAARRLLRIRVIIVCAALAAIVGLEFVVSESVAVRIGQAAACQSESPTAPNVTVSDLMAAAR